MASWIAGTSQSIVECQMCHVFMAPSNMEHHIESRHARSADNNSISEKSESTSGDATAVLQVLYCPICKKQVSKQRKKYVNHIKTHVQVSCVLCSVSVTLDKFTLHIDKCKISYNGDEICPICNFQLNTANKPNKHFKKHIACATCPFPKCSKSIVIENLKTHFRKHYEQIKTGPQSGCSTPQTSDRYHQVISPPTLFQDIDVENRIKCSLCPVLLTDKLDVKSHMYRHILHLCPLCQTSNLTESQFESHLTTCLNNQSSPLQCPQCTRRETTSKSLVRHIHHTHCSNLIKCDGCYNTIPCFTIKSHPTQCLKRVLPQLTGKQKQLLNSKNVDCLICKKQCKKTQISSHFLTHADFQCPYCFWSTEKLIDFHAHMNDCLSRIQPSSRTKYTCPVCYRNFSKAHFTEHTLGEHSYLCPVCNVAMSKNEFTFHGLLCTVIHNGFNISSKDTTKDKHSPHNNADIPMRQQINNGPSLPASKFSCPFCQSPETENLDQIRSHLISCETIKSHPSIQVVSLPDLVGLKIN